MAEVRQVNHKIYLNVFTVELYTYQNHCLDIQGVMASQTGIVFFSPGRFFTVLQHFFDCKYWSWFIISLQDKVRTLTTELERVRKQAKEVCPGLIFLSYSFVWRCVILKIYQKNWYSSENWANFSCRCTVFPMKMLCTLSALLSPGEEAYSILGDSRSSLGERERESM